MMTANTNRENVWIVTIHDKAPQGFLAFDLKEVLACLGPAVQGYSWLLTELDCTGEEAQPLCEQVAQARGAGVVLSTEELEVACRRISQTIDATLIGIPRELSDRADQGTLSQIERLPDARAAVVIRAVDSSFFEVFTKDPDHVRALQVCFQDVRTEVKERYFAAFGDRPREPA